MYIYLLHFHEPIHHAQHYIGWTKNLRRRLLRHAEGKAAHLTAEFARRAIPFTLARVWIGGRNDERQLKDKRHGPELCPICRRRPRKLKHLDEVPLTAIRRSGIFTTSQEILTELSNVPTPERTNGTPLAKE